MPEPKTFELKQKRARLLDESRGLVEKAEGEKRALTVEETTRVDAIFEEARGLAETISRRDRQDAAEKIGVETPGRRSDPLPHEDPANARGRDFSLLKAVRQAASRGSEPLDGLEREVSQEIAKRTGKSPQGFFMPLGHSRLTRHRVNGRRESRALDTTAGAGSIPTNLDKDWISLLRNRMVLIQAGATEIMDLHGLFAIPRQSAAATAYWVAQNGSPTGSNQTLDQVAFTPRTIGAFTDVSRRFFELSNVDGEQFVKEDLTAIIARGIDLAGLNGSGSSNQPTGVLQNSAITNVVALGTNGGAPTFTAMVDMETQVARGNADINDLGYIVNADGRGTMKTTAKIGSTYPVFLWEGGEVNGYPAYATQQLPANLTKGSGTGLSPIVFANWADLIIAYWSGVDILVDPYTGSSSGAVRIVALQDLDIQVRHPESFSKCVDMVTNQG